MNTNPFLTSSASELKNKTRARVKLVVYCVLAIHVPLLAVLLVQGCKREDAPPPASALDTNPPPPIVESNGPGTDLSSLPGGATNITTPPVIDHGPPPAVIPGAGQEYKVMKGDSFSTIAKKFNVSVKAIADANPGVDSTKLQINQKLIIPPPTAATAAPTGGATTTDTATGETIYTVKSGDTLTKIASDHGVSIKALSAANNLTTTKIKVGDKLKIPAKTPSVAPAPAPPSR